MAQDRLDLGVIGFSGLKEYGGVIDEEFHPKLRGDYGPKVYREMADNDSTIGAIRYIIRALTRQVEWRVEPASPETQSIEWAEFLESCLIDMEFTFEDFINEVLSFLDYGWSYFEVVYKMRRGLDTRNKEQKSQYDDGKIGWRKLALRAQDTLERWQFDEEDDQLEGMYQYSPYKGENAFIPIEKALLFRTETYKDNPEGRSIYRNAVVAYFFLKRIMEIEAIGIERDMTGLLTMEVPIQMLHQDASASDKALLASLQKMLAELKRDEREYAIIPSEMTTGADDSKPSGYKLKLLTTGGNRQIDTNATKLYYKTSILQSVMAQFIQLGLSNVGSFALVSSNTNLFSTALGSYLDTIISTFNRFGVSRLMQLNGVPQEYWPKLVHGDIEAPPLDEIGQYIQALAASGMLPVDDEVQNKLLEFAKLPIPEKAEGEATEKTRNATGLVTKGQKRIVGAPVRAAPIITVGGKNA
jgi:hypothetical protein